MCCDLWAINRVLTTVQAELEAARSAAASGVADEVRLAVLEDDKRVLEARVAALEHQVCAKSSLSLRKRYLRLIGKEFHFLAMKLTARMLYCY